MGPSYRSYIALDDLITGPTCIPYNQELPSFTLPTTIATTTFFPVKSLACDFECNCSCSWNFDPTGTINWIIKQGPSTDLFTGPTTDHTLQSSTGFYAYISTQSSVLFNDAARFISPILNIGSSGLCLQFFYHMYGANINRLNIYLKQNDNFGKPIWQKIGDQGNKWILGQVYVDQLGNFQLVIEGVAGNGIR